MLPIVMFSLFSLLNADFAKAQQDIKYVWDRTEQEIAERTWRGQSIKIFPSWIYLQYAYSDVHIPLEWIDKWSCNVLYKDQTSRIIQDKNGIYKIVFTEGKDRPEKLEANGKNGQHFELKWGKWYFLLPLSWADKASFHVINDYMAFDKNKIYQMNITWFEKNYYDGADPDNNKPIINEYAYNSRAYDAPTLKMKKYTDADYYPVTILWDKNGVHIGSIKIENADFDSFEIIRWTNALASTLYAKDKNNVYMIDDRIYEVTVLCKNTGNKIKMIWDNAITDGTSIFLENKKLEWADANSFKYDEKSYVYKDKNNVWLENGTQIKWADASSFKYDGQWNFYIDKNNVRLGLETITLVEWADPKTFKLMEDPKYNYEDKNNYYNVAEWKRYPKNKLNK